MQLQPTATHCFVSGEPFVAGARVASFLIRSTTLQIVRYDLLEANAAAFAPEGFVACRWVHVFKPRLAGENPDREMRMTAENLFTTLADPATEPTVESTRLVQFLALMLERKKLLRPRGRSADGLRNIYEHAKTGEIFVIPDPELRLDQVAEVQQQVASQLG